MGVGGLAAENQRLLAENTLLRVQLEAARRAGKRQAAPFSKGEAKKDPVGHRRRPAVRAAARPSLASLFAVVRMSLTHRCFPVAARTGRSAVSPSSADP